MLTLLEEIYKEGENEMIGVLKWKFKITIQKVFAI